MVSSSKNENVYSKTIVTNVCDGDERVECT